jgi:hypothetical protein
VSRIAGTGSSRWWLIDASGLLGSALRSAVPLCAWVARNYLVLTIEQ